MRKVILSSYFGTTIEYYDFLLYTSAASLVFAKVFFSNLSASVATILSFATLAGRLPRPPGRRHRLRPLRRPAGPQADAAHHDGLWAWHRTDRGRPDLHTIGVLGAVRLIACRVVQGVAVGGDWGGSATLSVEASEEGKRGLTAAL